MDGLMNDFYLVNHCPVSFNFLLFINRFYKYEPIDELKTVSLDAKFAQGLLVTDVFVSRLSTVWEKYIELYESIKENNSMQYNIIESNYQSILNNTSVLFRHDESGTRTLNQAWSIFISWFWYPHCGIFSQLNNISNEIITEVKLNRPLSKNISLQTVFDDIPYHLPHKGENFVIIPISQLVSKNKTELVNDKLNTILTL
ncbi:hypothetical protein COLU111180_18815 [Cohnella lubricantis]|uniref:Uncharacterized protein n=1 Tax=Cohnella lubricantis TaxID=2163172 RepID=A0A841TGF2_9BACL|nr:hypothetical protein [Cohnella lubricantis]MBB6678027.1 hypothetical protein [Cohnella lubricantis]MBP2119999.1 hypothetical protein [Cohnella lubricantis]